MMDTHDGGGARIYVLVKLSPGTIDDFVRKVSHLEGVTRVSPVTGTYDVVIVVDEESYARALKIVLKGIRTLPGVEETETLVEVFLD